MGVVSTKPGFVAGGGSVEKDHSNDVILALVGRVPVKISDENGLVLPGDRLTSSSIPGVAMKAGDNAAAGGMTIGMALESFNGTKYLSEGVADVLTQKEMLEHPETVKKKIIKDTRYQGADEGEAKRRDGGIEEVEIEETVIRSETTFKEPENKPVEELTTKDGKSVKVGKIMLFINLAPAKVDGALSTLANVEGGSIKTQWSVEMVSGKVNLNFMGDINMQGNNIVDVGKISGMFGKWQIDEEGKIIAREIEVEKATVKTELNIGTAEKPTGINIYDSATGAPYCVQIIHGALRSEAGVCSGNIVAPAPPPPPPSTEPPPPTLSDTATTTTATTTSDTATTTGGI